MKKLLITGSNGLLGQKLVYKALKSGNFEVYATARGENRLHSQEGYQYKQMDIAVKKQVEDVMNEIQPDIVINTAAMTNVDACEMHRDECVAINVNGVKHLVESCEKIGAHLIHLSTDFIFDGEDGPYSEDDEPNPLSFYGDSKNIGEMLIMKSNLSKWSIVRTVLVYGVVDDMSRSNIVLWAKGALEKGSPISVVDDQFRTPTLAEDLADGCLLIADKGEEGIFNISGKDFMSIYELVERVAAFFRLDTKCMSRVSSETLNQPAKRPPKTGFDISKAKNILGYKPHSFEEGLEIVKNQLKAS